MIQLNKWFSRFAMVALTATLYGCNLATIDAPLIRQTHYFEPVEMVISLEDNAEPETFQAWLNLKEISDKFEMTPNGMKAVIGPDDGLRTYEVFENGSIYLNGANSLVTKVKSGFGYPDVDTRLFFVKAGKVVTTRDDKGVWFITGPDDAEYFDVFEAMGYAVATDRLFQLELFRRQARGRLSEILGPSMLETDIYVRTLNYSNEELLAAFNDLPTDPKDAIEGYIAGINRRICEIRNNPSIAPYEFAAIGLLKLVSFEWTRVLEDWTLIDLLSWLTALQRNFDPNALSQGQIDNAALLNELVSKFGEATAWEMFQDLRWINDPDALTYIPGSPAPVSELMNKTVSLQADITQADSTFPDFPDLRQTATDMERTRNNVVESLKEINAHVKMGSYAWVVSGDKTKSGNPIIYSGPQMGFMVPSIVLEGSIRAGGIDISGMTVPGIPTILIGRTSHHAWSMQVGHSNTVDYYIEAPEDVFLHRTETIKVAGEDDVLLPIYRSAHGPVISPTPYDPDTTEPIIAWKYSQWGYEIASANGFLALARATNIDEFEEGIEDLAVSNHFCYADQNGNIAYWMSGRDPDRPDGEWRFPQGFGGAALEWNAENLVTRATDRNTSKGYYSGWNNKCHPDYDSPYGVFHRAHVVDDYLSSHNDLTFEDVRDLALNIATTDSFGRGGNPWKFVKNYFVDTVNSNTTPNRLAALDILENWDGHFVAGGPIMWSSGNSRAEAWVLSNAWIREVIRLTFEDELSSVPQGDYLLFNVLLHGLPGTALDNKYDWFQNEGTPQNVDDIIVTALDNVLLVLGEQPWGIEERGEITYEHNLLGEVHEMPFSSRSTYAHCVEYDALGPVRIESMFPLGESGNIAIVPLLSPEYDPNFFSMTDLFDNFNHRPFPLFD